MVRSAKCDLVLRVFWENMFFFLLKKKSRTTKNGKSNRTIALSHHLIIKLIYNTLANTIFTIILMSNKCDSAKVRFEMGDFRATGLFFHRKKIYFYWDTLKIKSHFAQTHF